jgi:pimeloyl-ACP methyl ester carboxylesterase
MRRREFIGGIGLAAVDAICRSSPVTRRPPAKLRITRSQQAVHLHFVEQGEGPLILLCHGFPDLWYSWRHQLPALSSAGYQAVAVDMRGYAKSDRPVAIDQYTLLHLVGDMLCLLDALGAQQALIVGHDWGAVVAWHAALLRPDRFRAVIALCGHTGRGHRWHQLDYAAGVRMQCSTSSISRSRAWQRPSLSAMFGKPF